MRDSGAWPRPDTSRCGTWNDIWGYSMNAARRERSFRQGKESFKNLAAVRRLIVQADGQRALRIAVVKAEEPYPRVSPELAPVKRTLKQKQNWNKKSLVTNIGSQRFSLGKARQIAHCCQPVKGFASGLRPPLTDCHQCAERRSRRVR